MWFKPRVILSHFPGYSLCTSILALVCYTTAFARAIIALAPLWMLSSCQPCMTCSLRKTRVFLLAVALRDDIRAFLPGLLPKFVALFGEAERGGGYDLVRPALVCLEALGTALEDHLALLLPALVRLIHPSERSSESCAPSRNLAPLYNILLERLTCSAVALPGISPY